jgi:hypothetical protein
VAPSGQAFELKVDWPSPVPQGRTRVAFADRIWLPGTVIRTALDEREAQ